MKRIYEQHKGKEVIYENDCRGVVVGYNDNRLVAAYKSSTMKTHPEHTFTKFDNEHVIEQEFIKGYRFFYVNENYFDAKFTLGGSQSASGMREHTKDGLTE